MFCQKGFIRIKKSMSIISIFSLLLGAIFGSFVNVVVWRLPRGQSIVKPRSYCPKCRHQIKWQQNIPIFSWLLLRGKCRFCSEPIPSRYIFVEVLSSLLFLVSIYSNPSSFELIPSSIVLIFGWILLITLLTISIIDLEHLWIPPSIIFFGILNGFIFLLISSLITYSSFNYLILIDHLLASLIGYFIFAFISKFGSFFYKKPVLGMGDAKLCSLLGIWLGSYGVLLSIYLTFIISGICSIILISIGKLSFGKPFALGPFISLSGFAVWLLGNKFLINMFF